MGGNCIGICEREYPGSTRHTKKFWSQKGYKHCSTCGFFSKNEDDICICCSNRWRTTPRDAKAKNKLIVSRVA